MRYIGSKAATLPAIQSIVERFAPSARSLCDPFAGTCTVSRHFKSLGLRVETGDLLWGSYIFQRAMIALNRAPAFAKLVSALDLDNADRPVDGATQILRQLDQMTGRRGFITESFSDAGKAGRRFFTAENAGRIDTIRGQIAGWSADGLIDECEEIYLLACLIDASDRVANTAGTYMAHLKQWGRKSLRPLEMRGVPVVDNGARNSCRRAQAWETAATEVDVLYLDPPYNTRDYSFYYHLPESLALWDGAAPTGKSGVPANRRHPISDFCVRARAAAALDYLLSRSSARLIVVHYASDGLIRHDEIVEMLECRGRTDFEDLKVRSYRSKIEQKDAMAHHRLYWCRPN